MRCAPATGCSPTVENVPGHDQIEVGAATVLEEGDLVGGLAAGLEAGDHLAQVGVLQAEAVAVGVQRHVPLAVRVAALPRREVGARHHAAEGLYALALLFIAAALTLWSMFVYLRAAWPILMDERSS